MRLAAIALLTMLSATALFAAPGIELSPDQVMPGTQYKKTALKFPDGKTISVDVVDTPAARERGLMFRKTLPKDYGMLFVFAHQGGLQFWMKNTWTSLDIIFIDKDKKVTVVHPRVKASTEKTTDAEVARVAGLAQYVLELPAGYAKTRKLKKGDTLVFEASIPKEPALRVD